ncbi:hypothetical protein LVJ94_05955 [Pendulispora rubella]|uniref:Uncharacterized protein n=1 Tax=Pendulispora rubella TaxID=2741070 RepID=A0ABZ2LDH1_9BACT
MVVTDGPGPNAAQRETMNKRIPAPFLVAVVTHAVMARRIVSVLSWFNPNIRAFAPADLPAALDYLDVRAEDQAGVIERVAEMRIQLSGAGVESVLDPMKAVITRLSQLRENIERSRRS